MTPTHRTDHRKLANWFALLAVATLLLSGIALPPAQAAPDAPQATTVIAALSDYGSGETTEQTVANMIAGWNPARIVTAGDNYHYQNCSTYANLRRDLLRVLCDRPDLHAHDGQPRP